MIDDWDDDEYPEEDRPDDDVDETDVVACPACGANVYEEAPQCPACGEYIVHHSRVWDDKPLWWILLGLAGIVAVIVVLSG